LVLNDSGRYAPKAFSPEFKSRNRSPIPYIPGAKCTRFKADVLGALKEEDQTVVQKMFGTMLLGYNLPQKILLFHGIGGKGKTTLALILQGVVGEENVSELRAKHLDDRFEISRYLGKSLLAGVDVSADFLSGDAISRLKGLVGGDSMDAERKQANGGFRLHGTFSVLITSNCRLKVKLQGDQAAWRRRLLLVLYEQEKPFKMIRDFDKVILREEAPGILLWGLEGLSMLRKDLDEHGDIVLTERQHQAIENTLEESDSLRIFLKRSVTRDDGKDLSVDELTSEYLAFCIDKKWVPIAPGSVHRQLESLMLEYFGTGKANSIERYDKSVRGFRCVAFTKEYLES